MDSGSSSAIGTRQLEFIRLTTFMKGKKEESFCENDQITWNCEEWHT